MVEFKDALWIALYIFLAFGLTAATVLFLYLIGKLYDALKGRRIKNETEHNQNRP